MAEYRKQIAYLDYLEDGVKIKNAGFVRIEEQNGHNRMEVKVKNLPGKDCGEFRLQEEHERTVGRISLQGGNGNCCMVWRMPEPGELDNSREESWQQTAQLRILLPGKRMLIANWHEPVEIPAQKETLQINGKMIKITEAVVKRKDYQKGSFVLYVTGTVNGSPFKNEFTFTGFVSKPDDYQMVNGAQAEWKANADYYAKLDFDSFYRLHKVNMFTIENLGRLVDFYSINVWGEKYLFTLEDLEKTVLEDIKYEQNQLSFYLRYNNSCLLYTSPSPRD
mgnify:FL=1